MPCVTLPIAARTCEGDPSSTQAEPEPTTNPAASSARVSGKAGCQPDAIGPLADAIAREPRLRLRGLMAIPAPAPDLDARRHAFARMRGCFETLRESHPAVDTLSMGMSDDFELAIREGATMVRVGSLLFGARGG